MSRMHACAFPILQIWSFIYLHKILMIESDLLQLSKYIVVTTLLAFQKYFLCGMENLIGTWSAPWEFGLAMRLVFNQVY